MPERVPPSAGPHDASQSAASAFLHTFASSVSTPACSLPREPEEQSHHRQARKLRPRRLVPVEQPDTSAHSAFAAAAPQPTPPDRDPFLRQLRAPGRAPPHADAPRQTPRRPRRVEPVQLEGRAAEGAAKTENAPPGFPSLNAFDSRQIQDASPGFARLSDSCDSANGDAPDTSPWELPILSSRLAKVEVRRDSAQPPFPSLSSSGDAAATGISQLATSSAFPTPATGYNSSPVQTLADATSFRHRFATAEEAVARNLAFRSAVWQHAYHLREACSQPELFLSGVQSLLTCLNRCEAGEPVTLDIPGTGDEVAVYCTQVLREVSDILRLFPAPILTALQANPALRQTSFSLHPEHTPFPAASAVWHPPLGVPNASIRALEAEAQSEHSVSRRLQGNLEAAWDAVLSLQRKYRGDISSFPPGTLDVQDALRAMAMVHPANMDVFAARFLSLVSQSALHAGDAPPKMRQLGERLRAGGDTLRDSRGSGGGRGGRGGRAAGRGKGPGVVLHRLPELVRSMFDDDPAQLFFLDFLTGVDSAKLNTALVPRLVASVAKALEAAACATSNIAFTDAVLEGRLFAKLLSVIMHAANWAHSAFSLSGIEDKHTSPGLGAQALLRRVPIHSALFAATVDVKALLLDAVKSSQILAVIATVAVADVLVRLAAVDPIAMASDWYGDAVCALRHVRVLSGSEDSNGVDEESDFCMPLLHVLISDILKSDSSQVWESRTSEPPSKRFVLRCDPSEWPAIGDVRMLRSVCPRLDKLRKDVQAGLESAPQRAIARRITPQAATSVSSTLPGASLGQAGGMKPRGSQKGGGATHGGAEVQALLKREFYARMDGRLRELIRVVVASRPADEDRAKESFLQIVRMLYPDTSETVAAVAANLCGYELGVLRSELESVDHKGDGNRRGGRTHQAGRAAEGPDESVGADVVKKLTA